MAKIRLANIRFGFANNSSSSHSMVFFDNENDSRYTSGERGYGTPKDKMDYFAYAFCQEAAACGVNPRVALMAVRDLLGCDDAAPKTLSGESGHPLAFPVSHSGGMNMEFARELAEFVKRPDVAFDFSENDDRFTVPTTGYDSAGTVARKDPVSGVWTLFSRQNGTKVRFAFPPEGEREMLVPLEDEEFARHPVSIPELVDVKITNHCDNAGKACAKHCYQASTPDGNHASLASVVEVASRLAAAEVFEVALGGGETTSHPDFVSILKVFKGRGIVPNFTTSETDWLDGPNAREILELAGGFAFSAQTPTQAKEFLKRYEKTVDSFGNAKAQFARPSIQHVVGTAPVGHLRDFFALENDHRVSVTLLGYKTTGRGSLALDGDKAFAAQVEEATRGWIAEAKRYSKAKGWLSLSIDTALAAVSESGLAESGNGRVSFHVNEGDFSMYVDAVRMTMSRSSYHGGLGTGSREPFDGTWRERFAAYGAENAKNDGRRTLQAGRL